MITLKNDEGSKLQNITIALPEIYCDNLRKLQEMGIISSRSDGIRRAISEFLNKEIENLELLGIEITEDKPNEVEDNYRS
ncbi:MAG: ribbon-helix-helix protein, CopG family [Promethearchaeota archaeon]